MKKTIKNLLTYILTSAAFLFLAVGFLMPKAETAYAEDTYYTVSFNTSRLSDVGITLNIPSQQVRSGDYAVKPTQITGDVEWWGDMPWDFDFNNTPITKDITIHLVGSGYSGYSDFKEQTIKAYKVDNEIVHVSVDENNYTPATPTKAGYTFDSWTASDIHITETLNYVIDYTVSGDNNAEEDIGNRAFSLKTARYFEWSGFIGFETSSDDIYNTTDMWIEQIGFYNGSTSIFSVQLLAYNGGHIIKLMAPKDGGGTNSKEYRFKSGSTVIDVGFESGFRSAGGVYLKVVLDKTTGKISLFVRRDNDSNRSWINPVIWNGGGQVFSNVDLTETSSHLVNSDVNMAKYMIRNMYDLTTSRGFTNQKVEAYGTGDVLYTAQFLENHTVTYMVDGNEYSREQVADGDNPTFPTPSKAQCTFSGWQVSGDNTLYGNGDGYVVTHDVTFNAVFTGEQYTITYMVDGQFWLSDNATYGEPYYITGWDVGEGQAPTKTGYTFTGWYLNDTRFTTPCSVESNITLTAGFEETYYTLSFYSDNVLVGTVSFPAYVNGNPSDDYHSNEWPTVTKTGYTFSHWAPYAAIDPNTGDYVYFFDNDARLDAIFTINTYTVTYMVNGAVYSTEQVSHGSSATFPTPQNNGLNFNGWKIYNGVDMLYGGNTGNTYTVTHNETFDAVFALEITYVVDGTTYDTETIDYNGSPTFPSPTKTHYTFVGWTLRGGDSRLYGNNSGNTYTVKSAATFDAEFEPVTYTATFIVDGTTTGKVTVTYPNSVTLSTPNKNHYTFDGWRISGSDENLTGSYQMTADTTFTAHFTADTYTATFVVDGLTAATENVVYPNAVTLPPQTKQGYTFDGWRISGSDENLTGSYQMTADTTFTAHFTINHTVTYELGDGTVYFMEQIPHGSNATLPTPQVEGYIFDGWAIKDNYGHVLYGGNTGRDFGVTEDVIFKAELGAIPCVVTYIVDGETVRTETLIYGDNATLPNRDKTGYTFNGWQVSGDNELYGANTGNTYRVTESVTFTAQFTANTYTATFVVDGLTTATENVVYPNSVTLPTPTKTGYTFVGWRIAGSNENLTGSYQMTENTTFTAHFTVNQVNLAYYNGNTFLFFEPVDFGSTISYPTLLVFAANDIEFNIPEGYAFDGWADRDGNRPTIADKTYEFYAVFTPATYTITFMVDNIEYDTAEYHYGDTIEYPDAPEKTGYTFIGWKNTDNEMPKTVTGNETFTAVYKAKSSSSSGSGSSATTNNKDKGEMFISCGDFNLTGGCGGTTAGAGNGGLLASVLSGILFMVAINALRRKKKAQ